ncbi:hypothetical protein GCM10027347_57250 [Larkinella harenae]
MDYEVRVTYLNTQICFSRSFAKEAGLYEGYVIKSDEELFDLVERFNYHVRNSAYLAYYTQNLCQN